MEFTRVNNDVNGNPRYVVHWLDCEPKAWRDNAFVSHLWLTERYASVVKLMNKIGGRKFHNKQYGGGIVFQSYDINTTKKDIEDLKNNCK
jgi:hypothetical protein